MSRWRFALLSAAARRKARRRVGAEVGDHVSQKMGKEKKVMLVALLPKGAR